MALRTRNIIIFAIGIMAIFASIILLSFFGSFSRVMMFENLFSGSNPLGVFFIFAALIFGGTYFFKAAGNLIKQTVK